MSVSAEIEREFKFDVDTDFDPPDLRPVVGRTVRLPEQEHRTVYLDTADRRLWERGITLRHRATLPAGGAPGAAGPAGPAGEGPAVSAGAAGVAASGSDGTVAVSGKWTLKLPVAGDDSSADDSAGMDSGGGRAPGISQRSELSWDGERREVPEPVRHILAGVVRRAPLTEIVELAAVRRRLLLQLPDGAEPWGEVDDDLVSVTGGASTGRRFRQIEVELAGNQEPPPGQVEAVLEQMRRAGASPGGQSKLGAALGLTQVEGEGAEPARPRRAKAARKAPMPEVVSDILTADLDVVLDCDVRLRRVAEAGDEPGVELIHRARVGFRRLRAHVRTLDPVLDPVWVRHVRSDLKTVGRALGRVRDADVLIERLRRHDEPDDREGLEELVHLVAADRALAASELVPLMAGSTYLDLLDRLVAAAGAPPLYSPVEEAPARLAAGPVMHDLVGRRWRRTTEEIAGLGDQPDERDLHRVRIRAKRLRYAAEAAGPYTGRDGRQTAKRAKSLQKVLGEVHDSASAAAWLRQLGSHPSITPTAAFVAGRIAGQEEASARRAGRDWRRSAARLRSKRMRAAFG